VFKAQPGWAGCYATFGFFKVFNDVFGGEGIKVVNTLLCECGRVEGVKVGGGEVVDVTSVLRELKFTESIGSGVIVWEGRVGEEGVTGFAGVPVAHLLESAVETQLIIEGVMSVASGVCAVCAGGRALVQQGGPVPVKELGAALAKLSSSSVRVPHRFEGAQ